MIKGVIQQFCKTLKQAESIQAKLYEKYDSVQLVSFPTTQEEGVYTFKVEKKHIKWFLYLKLLTILQKYDIIISVIKAIQPHNSTNGVPRLQQPERTFTMKHTLFIGLNDKDTKQQEIDTITAYKTLIRLMTKNGYTGGTISQAEGFYTHQDGSFTTEKMIRVEIIDADTIKTTNLINDIKIALNQECVGLQEEVVKTSFV